MLPYPETSVSLSQLYVSRKNSPHIYHTTIFPIKKLKTDKARKKQSKRTGNKEQVINQNQVLPQHY